MPTTTDGCVSAKCRSPISPTHSALSFTCSTKSISSERARRYRTALRGAEVVYAGKALLTIAVARWARKEGLSVEVGSPGEPATAIAGGVDPARLLVHGNAKSHDDLRAAVQVGAKRIVLNSGIEIAYLSGLTGRRQPVLMHVALSTDSGGRLARVGDQQFGFSLAGGRAADASERILAHLNLDLIGLHCHLGPQIADAARYGEAVRRMVTAMADICNRHGVILTELDLGGGHAVSSVPGAIETQPGGRAFVAVDGGVSDDPRLALNRTKCTVALANRHSIGRRQRVTVMGRHCEADDELIRDVELPATCAPVTCSPLPVPAPAATAWLPTTPWSVVRRWWRCEMAAPASWSGARRWPTCGRATAVKAANASRLASGDPLPGGSSRSTSS